MANASFLQLCIDFVLRGYTFCPEHYQLEPINDRGLSRQPAN